MKTIINIILISALAFRVDILNAQTVNWAVQNGSYKNMFSAKLSLDYGFVYGLSYGHQFNTKVFPFIASIEYSAPAGIDIFDDFKVETGINIRWIQLGHFQFSTKINGIFRRYENDFVRLLNFGSNLSGIFGYYRSRWFAACEIGFDKAIVTHFRHSETYKDRCEKNNAAAETAGIFCANQAWSCTRRRGSLHGREGSALLRYAEADEYPPSPARSASSAAAQALCQQQNYSVLIRSSPPI